MKYFYLTLASLLFLILGESCLNRDTFRPEIKTLDSLSGALNGMKHGLESTDTLRLNSSISTFKNIGEFIRLKIQDTISKEEAEQLKIFFAAGENLEKYALNRNLLLARATRIQTQLIQLSEDIDHAVLSKDQAQSFVRREKEELNRWMEAAVNQQNLQYENNGAFRSSLKSAEELVKKRNQGVLPVVVTNSNSN
jgi:hypothetical protein